MIILLIVLASVLAYSGAGYGIATAMIPRQHAIVAKRFNPTHSLDWYKEDMRNKFFLMQFLWIFWLPAIFVQYFARKASTRLESRIVATGPAAAMISKKEAEDELKKLHQAITKSEIDLGYTDKQLSHPEYAYLYRRHERNFHWSDDD